VCSQAFFEENVGKIPPGLLVKVAKYLKKVENPERQKLKARKTCEFYVAMRE
jgi:hypothetical protein